MTSVSVQQLDNGDAYSGNTAVNGGDSADQITKLFPKCRPRADVNLNPVVPLTLLDDTQNMTANTQPTDLPDMDRSLSEHQETTPAASPPGSACLEVSSDEAEHETSVKDNQVIILTNNKGGTYKLRDSRIIEIAGGREIYSQSRMKAGRKPRCVGDNSEKKYGVWDVRGTRMNDVRKQRSGREVTETVFSTEVCSVRHQRPGQQNMDTNETTSAVSGSEVVVFDDIGDDCLRASPDLDSISPERNNKVAQVIGNLPIAVYEGSPRRYGLRQTDDSGHPSLPSAHSLLASPSVYPPRPGFPQRIVTTPSEGEHPRDSNSMSPPVSSTFDYLYEFSETRKVLEEFFKCRPEDENNHLDEPEFQDLDYELHRQSGRRDSGSSYVGQRLAKGHTGGSGDLQAESPRKPLFMTDFPRMQEHENLEQENNFLDLSVGTGSSGDLGETEVGLQVGHSRNFTLSPETTDCDSNCGDLDSEMSLMIDNDLGPLSGDMASQMDCLRLCSSMPVLEDGLSSGHASDTDNNNPTVLLMKRQITEIEREIVQKSHLNEVNIKTVMETQQENRIFENNLPTGDVDTPTVNSLEDSLPEISAIDPLAADMTPPPPAPAPHRRPSDTIEQQSTAISPSRVEAAIQDIRMALQRAKTLPHTSAANSPDEQVSSTSPVWVPRQRSLARDSETVNTHKLQTDDVGDEEEADTDLETDRLLGQQRTDDQGFYDDKLEWRKPKSRTIMPTTKSSTPKQSLALSPVIRPTGSGGPEGTTSPPPPCSPSLAATSPPQPSTPRQVAGTSPEKICLTPQNQKGTANSTSVKTKKEKENKKKGRNKEDGLHDPTVLIEGVLFRARYLGSTQLVCEGQPTKSTRMMQAEEAVSRIKEASDRSQGYGRRYGFASSADHDDESPAEDDDDDGDEDACEGGGSTARPDPVPLSAGPGNASGTVFRLQFLGSVEVEEEGGRKRRKRLKKNMVEEAVTKIKAPDGESQPSTEVDLFISTEKIMVLNTDLKEIMMDHALRTISYIADIGDLVVLMARRRLVPHEMEDPPKINRTPKMICHVFESEEAQFIAQSIGQAFQVAYMEFLKANGIEDHSFVKEMDYQEVLNSQEIFGDELQMFAKKEMQKEVVVPKAKGEILGVVIVESGWGSMLPTVVIANLAPAGAAARCGQLNIGDQIIAINGVSLVGLPLSTCQNYIKNSKNQTVVKLTVVPCAPVVEVKIKRPDTKYQLGFSVQNGVICSLLRGGIAERGGVRVGHRIIEINNQSVVAVPHEKIVNLLATSIGEILMKTMPTSMFRLLTGQENPVYI